MEKRTLLTNARITTGEYSRLGALGIEGSVIYGIWLRDEGVLDDSAAIEAFPGAEVIDLGGKVLMAGAIDCHVHFREPGMTHKADMESESRMAILGGVTSFFDMPNTAPPTVSEEALRGKLDMAKGRCHANYGFHIGATNDNAEWIRAYVRKPDALPFGGIKVFMGSSTGNMLVDREKALTDLFRVKGRTILTHCEDEGMIKANLAAAKNEYRALADDGSVIEDRIPFKAHPLIRSREACVKSTEKALELAIKYGSALHVLHVSTAEEVEMIREAKKSNPLISCETSSNYLWFSDEDYDRFGSHVKCNPAIKSASDRAALREGLADGTVDTLGSDHAPHLKAEKDKPYLSCPSGMPSIREALSVAISVASGMNSAGKDPEARPIPLTTIAKAYSENPAKILGLDRRGKLEKGYYADLTVIDPEEEHTVAKPDSRCGWSPYEGFRLKGRVKMVFLNGRVTVDNGRIVNPHAGVPLRTL